MAGHLERITTFLAVAEASSFSAAARALGGSASQVTRHVAELEDHLGVQLFVRTTRKVSLTQAGEAYAARMAPLVSDMGAADDAVRGLQTDVTGRLRISSPLSFGTRFLTAPLRAFRAAHPRIALSVNLTDRFVDILAEEVDMALRISGPPSDRSTIWRKIRQVPRSLVASPGYLDARGRPGRPEDLGRHACLSYTHLAQGEVWQLTDPASGETRPVRQSFDFACNNGDLLAQMAMADQGIVMLPDFLLRAALNDGRLERILPRWRPPEIWLTAFYPPYQKLPIVMQRFTEVFEAQMADVEI